MSRNRNTPKNRMGALLRQAHQQDADIRRIQNSRRVVPRRLENSRLSSSAPSGAHGEIALDEDNCLWVYVDGEWIEFVCGNSAGFQPPVSEPSNIHPMIYGFDYDFEPGPDIWQIGIAYTPDNHVVPFLDAEDHKVRPVWNWTHDRFAYAEKTGEVSGPVGFRLCTMKPDGTERMVVAEATPTFTKHFSFKAFSPDGTKLAYVGSEALDYPVFVKNSDGTGEAVQLGDWSYGPVSFSPDGEWVYWGNDSVWRRKPDGSEPAEMIFDWGNAGGALRLNAAGTHLLSDYWGSGRRIIIIPVDGSTPTEITQADLAAAFGEEPGVGTNFDWTPDGEWIVDYWSNLDGHGTGFPAGVIAFKTDLSELRQYGFYRSGFDTTNPIDAGDNTGVSGGSLALVNDTLHVVIQYEDNSTATSGYGLAAYPFDDPDGGFWLINNALQGLGEVTTAYARYYANGRTYDAETYDAFWDI